MFAVINSFENEKQNNLHIYDLLYNIIKNTDSQFINVNKLIENKGNIKNFLLETFDCIPKYYITFYGIGTLNIIIDELSSVLKVVLINDDIHHSLRLAQDRIQPYLKSYLNFNTYGYQLNRWNLPNVQNNYYFPHSARWLIAPNKDPINKILVSGATTEIYSDRNFVINLKHPKIDILKKKAINDTNAIYCTDFYNYLNKYLCCFVDTARDYTLAKIFEICGSGSLLLCMNSNIIDIFDKLGFIDGINYITCTRENIIEKIDYITNPINIEEINKIRNRGFEIIKEKHNYEYRYKVFLEILNGTFIKKKCYNEKYKTDYYLGF